MVCMSKKTVHSLNCFCIFVCLPFQNDSLQHFDRVWFYRDVVHQLFLFMKMFGFSFHETRELGLPHIASRALGNLTAATASSSANKVILTHLELLICVQ